MSGADDVPSDLHYVADVADFAATDRVLAEVQGLEIAVFATEEGFAALANHCVHQGGPICEGRLGGALGIDDDFELTYDRDGRVVACPWHGWEFDVTTGRHLVPSGYRQPTFEVVERDGAVYVRL